MTSAVRRGIFLCDGELLLFRRLPATPARIPTEHGSGEFVLDQPGSCTAKVVHNLKVRSVSTFALIVAVPSIVLLSSSPFDCCAQVYQRLTWSGAMAAQSRKIAREFVSRLMSRAKCGR